VKIKNRVAMTPMGVCLATTAGGVNDVIIAFFEARIIGDAARGLWMRPKTSSGWRSYSSRTPALPQRAESNVAGQGEKRP